MLALHGFPFINARHSMNTLVETIGGFPIEIEIKIGKLITYSLANTHLMKPCTL